MSTITEMASQKLKSKMKESYFDRTYRESTLYDFSLVSKAKIYVYEYHPNEPELSQFKYCEVLPVQINPSEYRKYIKVGEKGKIRQEELENIHHNRESEKTLNIPLKFSIVDEYMAISNNGMIPYPVDVDSATIISKLYKYSTLDYRLLFKWGTLAYLSYVDSISCTYEKFSPYGEPLEIKGELTLHEHTTGFSGNREGDSAEELLGATNWGVVKSQQKIESVAVAAQIVLNDAANEALPTVISKLRG